MVWQQLLSDQVGSSAFFLKHLKFITQHFNIVLQALAVYLFESPFAVPSATATLPGVYIKT